MYRWSFGDGVLVLVQGDITTAQADAIVNAANPSLSGGGGVDGAIHGAAGPDLHQACREISQRIGRLETGKAVATPGFRLRAQHVLHTVGPIWRGGEENEATLLRLAYENSLLLAQQLGHASVAFPAISCGVYGYPLELAAPLALNALCEGLLDGLVAQVQLWLHGQASFEYWNTQAVELFGPPQA